MKSMILPLLSHGIAMETIKSVGERMDQRGQRFGWRSKDHLFLSSSSIWNTVKSKPPCQQAHLAKVSCAHR